MQQSTLPSNQLSELSQRFLAIVSTFMVIKDGEKGQLLISQGKVCRDIFVIEQGFARSFYLHDGKDVTAWFAAENDILISMCSFLSGRPSYESVELLEPSVLWCIPYDCIENLYDTSMEFNVVSRQLIEYYYLELEEHTMSLQFQTTKERYAQFLEKQPHVFQRTSLGHIASYLGMTQENLSRIRGKK
jgi:CRP/FNR family transcriptional regulator, anaerobic regulatory protein